MGKPTEILLAHAFSGESEARMPSLSPARLVRQLLFHRWFIPLTLSVIGCGYVLWEAAWLNGYAPRTLLGLVLLGVAGPGLAWATLTWTLRVAQGFQQTEQRRERQHQQLLALNKIGEAVNQSLELDAVLNHALDLVLELMRLESGQVRLVQDGRLVLRAARCVSPTFVAAEPAIDLGQCVCGKAAQTGELIAISDLGRSPHFAPTACACEKFEAVLSVPVRTADRVVGVIHLASQMPRTFDAAERALLTTIGGQLGGAIEKARLHAELKTLNQQLEAHVAERTHELVAAKEELTRKADVLAQVLAEERRIEEKTRAQIAHDLHDGVQQLIIGALFETQAARDALQRNPLAAATCLVSAQDLLRRIEAEMRRAIYSLRPVALDAHGLVPALRELAEGFARRTQIECSVSVEGTPRRFNPDAEVVTFRIAQEALNNIHAHAHAQHAHIHLAWGVRELHAEIVDDGAGFEIAQVTRQTRTHLGLIGMQERAESVGGTFAVISRRGEGTRVSVRVPVN